MIKASITVETKVVDNTGRYVKKRPTGTIEVRLKYDSYKEVKFADDVAKLLTKYCKKLEVLNP